MFEDSGAGIREDLTQQLYNYVKPLVYSDCEVYVYPPGYDSSGMDDEDREMLGIQEDKQGWRVKIYVSETAYIDPPKSDLWVGEIPQEIHRPQERIVPSVLLVLPLRYDRNLNVLQETFDAIRANLTERGIPLQR